MAPDRKRIILEGQWISVSQPEWGEPGISPLDILAVVCEVAVGEPPRSETASGSFWYRQIVKRLTSYWRLDAQGL